MAKTLAILASLLLFFVLTVICVPAKDRNDPSLEIIKHEDAEEGYVYQVKESLVCDDPKAPDNTVATLNGMPPHMSSTVRVTCDEGTHFIGSEKTSVDVRCEPLPHPCMCMAAWETLDDYMLMYNFNCTKDRIQNEIKTKDTHEERTGRASPAEEVQQEQHEPNNQNSISATESESETQEFIPEEDLDDTIFEYNVDEKQNDVNIEVADQQGDIEDTKEHTFTDINEVIDTVDEETETENPEHVTEAELQEQETEEKKLRIEINDIVQNIPEHENEEEIEEISEGEEYDQEENNEIYESQNSQSEDLSYEYEEEEEMEENEVQNSHEYAEEGEEENNTEENEEELNEEQNMEEGYEENNNEETFEDENQPEKDEAENAEEANEGETEGTEGQSEESEDESDRNAWFEEGMNVDENEEEEENDFPNVKSPSIIYTAIAELTKYDEDNDNTEYFDDGIYDMVEPPEDLNTVQTYPVEATDDAVTTQEDTVCSLPTQSGPCKAYFQRYFYNSNSGECELFIYGGCNGNANNFNTLNECESTCVRRVHL